ncbi:unnamed protein product [Effrenium voratum]|uniref:RING-type domain-containing protein n=1 Tax=Effrenium voratum TaxID=2562239 RepID=A0AA36I5N0_9DINO|nr:unnamed protein product [Effrenium voratum]
MGSLPRQVVLRLLYTNPFIRPQELRDSLWEAVRNCQLEVLRSLLEFRVDPMCEPSESISSPPPQLRNRRWTPLLALAVDGSAERAQVVGELLSHRCDIGLADKGRVANPVESASKACQTSLKQDTRFPALDELEKLQEEELQCLERSLEAQLQLVRRRRCSLLEGRLQSVQRRHEEACRNKQDLEEEQCCVVCSELQKSVVFMPCRHLCTCLQCSVPLELCPICRASIEKKVQCIRP